MCPISNEDVRLALIWNIIDKGESQRDDLNQCYCDQKHVCVTQPIFLDILFFSYLFYIKSFDSKLNKIYLMPRQVLIRRSKNNHPYFFIFLISVENYISCVLTVNN